ncbi:ABC transporter permease [Alkalihalobacterium bogoriense]|uniref:ABC transporter permease n=1 Tax=Alkalihalobacterium bogoriense TaxID=246272 RepID=UPI00047B35A1|nr:ABC transporter permease [Alkalihalobacterium bogoriense]
MKSVESLWSVRVKDYWNMAIRYLRLIGNSGFLFTIYLLLIIGGYYYSVLLDWLPPQFPAVYVFVIVFTFMLTRSPVRTFVKQGDIVFITPLEAKLSSYFRSSIMYSVVLQSCTLIVVMIVLSPLFTERVNTQQGAVYSVIGLLMVAKVWNVLCSWEEQRLQSKSERFWHQMLRIVVNAAFTFLIFSGAQVMYIAVIVALLFVLYFFYYRHFEKKHSIKWEHLLEEEERMLTLFYRVANTFTDVPKLKNKVQRRVWMQWVLRSIPFKKKTSFLYLFTRTFLRANDYFGLYIRLLVVGGVLLFVIPEGIGRVLLFLLFIYMSGLQMSTLWKHYDMKIWVDLYPIDESEKKQAFSKLLFSLLFIKTVIFSLLLFVIGDSFVHLLILFILGAVFSYFYSYSLVFRKVKVAT